MSTTTILAGADATVTVPLIYQLPPSNGEHAYIKSEVDEKKDFQWNFVQDKHDIQIENIHGNKQLYTLKNIGFQIYNCSTKFTAFHDDKKVQEEYYPKSTELIKELTGVSCVILFDHTHHLHQPGELGTSPDHCQPAGQIHVDQTMATSIAHNDTFPVMLIYPDHEGETMGVKYNSKHQWKYVCGLMPNEFVLIKCFNSIQDGSVAVYTPHTSFTDPTTPVDAPPQESIELRALVFYD
ncbi:hypothetical protein P691DRAFT_849774 [Macrolepiota fuliginosa MF-IS2]|uniref:Uncharacterized protein n=1 Tax=Macrolepiota fuliginosa MF-IS2 TaxID=1400762 RepID=A0A9P6BWM0_9AGAR|nr:hypothetical protein P691DRAFT_849774 [Macrolepiota fuliginosa MF-IS2]